MEALKNQLPVIPSAPTRFFGSDDDFYRLVCRLTSTQAQRLGAVHRMVGSFENFCWDRGEMSQMTITGTFESDDVRRRLDQSEQPLYVALSSLLRAEITQGRWAAGVQLPTIAELSQRYSVARVTIRQALGVLSSAGLIYA